MAKRAHAVLIILLLNVFAVIYLSTPTSGESLWNWQPSSQYPMPGFGPSDGSLQYSSCVQDSGIVYCVGGGNYYTGDASNITSFAHLSAAGISPWTRSSPYPVTVRDESCVASGGYVYCVGGFDPRLPSPSLSSAYFAPLTGSGVGQWSSTTPYPVSATSLSCVSDSDYIYCVGGYDYGVNVATDSVYYAPLTSSGIGAWLSSTPYPAPTFSGSCVDAPGTVACVGGTTNGVNGTASDYFAQVSSSGVGTWTATTPYPTQISDQSCASYSGYVYCVGGMDLTHGAERNAVYYSPLGASGIGSWTGTAAYPYSVFSLSCSAYSGYLYCVGGLDQGNSTFYTKVFSPSGTATATGTGGSTNGWHQGPGYPTQVMSESCTGYGGYVYCVGGETAGGIFSASTNASYYSQVTSSGPGPWTPTTSYPGPTPDDCAAAGGFLYCVSHRGTFYASLGPSGIGPWSSTTPYPANLTGFSCATSSGDIYCVGGAGFNSKPYDTNVAYFAPVSSTGIGPWSATADLPTIPLVTDCVATASYIYCAGSQPAYYAPTSASGLGPWSATSSMPVAPGTCASDSNYVYCTDAAMNLGTNGDGTFFASLTSSGLSPWVGTTSYPFDDVLPFGVSVRPCAVASGFLVCVGGQYPETSNYGANPPIVDYVYYASLAQLTENAATAMGTTTTHTTGTQSTIQITGLFSGVSLTDIAFDPHDGLLYAASYLDPGAVLAVDPQTGSVVANISVGADPTALAFDSTHDRIYVANYGTLYQNGTTVSVISDSTNAVVANVNVGADPGGLAFDQSNGRVYVANSLDGTVSVIDTASESVVATVTVGSYPSAVAYDSSNGDVYVVNQVDGTVSVIDSGSNGVVATIPVGSTPQRAAFDPVNQDVYVTFSGGVGSGVAIIDGSSNTLSSTLAFGTPMGIAYDSTLNAMFVTNEGNATISQIDASTNSVAATYGVGPSPFGVAFDQSDGLIYATGAGSNTIYVVSPSQVAQTTTTSTASSTSASTPTATTAASSTSTTGGGSTATTGSSTTSPGGTPPAGGVPDLAYAAVGVVVVLLLLFVSARSRRQTQKK